MAKPTVVFLDRATIPEQIVVPSISCEHNWREYDFTRPDQTLARSQDAQVLITNKVVLDKTILSQLPDLKLIAVSATGFNNVDIDYCREHGIAVANIQGYATKSVPEHVIAMMFALRRNLRGYHQDIMAGEWQRNNQFCFFTHPIGDIAGSTLGIIGGGVLGQSLALVAKALGMNVLFAEHKGKTECRSGYVPFEQVLAEADVVSLNCPLSEQTRNLIDKPELALMKSSAILINAGRGGLVEESALVDALKSGEIAGAGVDVFTQEPADKSNPLIANADLPNLILTPHVAWGSDSAITRLAEILVDNIDAFLQGKEQNRVV